MSIAELNELHEAQRRILVLESRIDELARRVVALEKDAVSRNTLHLKDKKRG
jgi:hypothetical protein